MLMQGFRRKFSANGKFCLAKKIFGVKRNRSLKLAEKVFRNHRSQMSGNPV
jgi:hypothetical protein